MALLFLHVQLQVTHGKGVSLQTSRTDGQSTGFNYLRSPEQDVLRSQPLGCSIAKDTKTAQAPLAPPPQTNGSLHHLLRNPDVQMSYPVLS